MQRCEVRGAGAEVRGVCAEVRGADADVRGVDAEVRGTGEKSRVISMRESTDWCTLEHILSIFSDSLLC